MFYKRNYLNRREFLREKRRWVERNAWPLFLKSFDKYSFVSSLKIFFALVNYFGDYKEPIKNTSKFLEDYFRPEFKERFNKENRFLSQYYIGSHGSYFNAGNAPSGMWGDSYFGFVLFKRGEEKRVYDQALAVIGFTPEKNRTVHVCQLQGNKNVGNDLCFFNWEDMFLHIFGIWSLKNGFSRISINSSNNIRWKALEGALFQRWTKRYDETAKRNGFEYDPENKKYFKDLEDFVNFKTNK